MRRGLRAAVMAVWLVFVGAATAQEAETPFLLRADEIVYDSDNGIVTARGNVEIVDGERVLRADRLTYVQRDDLVTASGDVSVLEPDGHVVFANYVELSDGMKRGLIREIRMLLTDGSRLAANGAVRGGGRTVMSKAVYSPCELCKQDPTRAPLWQLKAAEVVHNEAARTIEYTDVTLEVAGIPVAYTPYFSHPDPTVTRRTGFLSPVYGSSSVLGKTIQVPYYFNLAPNMDATFEPILTTEEGAILAGEFRHRTNAGRYDWSGSVTHARTTSGEKDVRGHVQGTGQFRINDTWRWGFEGIRATDDTYLGRYGFDTQQFQSGQSTLVANARVEGFRNLSYAAANAYTFQDLDEAIDSDTTPLILPLAELHAKSAPTAEDGRWFADTSLLSLTRKDGADSHRVSVAGGWEMVGLGEGGDVWGLRARTRGDVYVVSDVADPSKPASPAFSGVTGRIFPELVADWRLPLVRHGQRLDQLVEPIASLVVSPYGGNPAEIPNEDSQEFEFDDTNLFNANRFTGLDRVESGPRLNYGLRFGLYDKSAGSVTGLLGQSFRTKEDDTFTQASGLANHFSDVVGRLRVTPGGPLSATYRFRLNHADLSPRRHDVGLALGTSIATASISYLFVEEEEADFAEDPRREEVTASGTLRLGRYWSTRARIRRDVLQNENISENLGLVYEDECTTIDIDFQRSFTRDRDVEPSTDFFVRIRLKHLG